MRRYTLIVVPEGTGRVQRLGVSERGLKRLIGIGAAASLLFVLGFAHYLTLCSHMSELRGVRAEAERVRAEADAQRAELQRQAEERQRVADELARVREFERRVRVIANLPQASLEQRTAQRPAAPLGVGGGAERPEDATPPMGTPTAGAGEDGEGGPVSPGTPPDVSAPPAEPISDASSSAARPSAEVASSEGLLERLQAESRSLEELLGALRGKSERLAATPSAWPAEGWITSGFGYRISPFTGRRDFHEGIDIAAEFGTPILAPAPGRVVFAGRKGGLGMAIIVDHGYGVRTTYGHLQRMLVQAGSHVARGQQLATMGSSGLSTGPHVHYMVEVGGKRVDPLDYIVE